MSELKSIDKLKISFLSAIELWSLRDGEFPKAQVKLFKQLITEIDAIQSEHDRLMAEKLPSVIQVKAILSLIENNYGLYFDLKKENVDIFDNIVTRCQSKNLVSKE